MTSTNEMGATVVFDGGCPRTITFKAMLDISGGQFVVFSGAGVGGLVSSGASTFSAADILAVPCYASLGSALEQINGIALYDVASGTYGAAATRGAYIVKVGGSLSPGTLVEAMGPTAVRTIGSKVVPTAEFAGNAGTATCIPGATTIGRCIVPGASGTNSYGVVYLNI